MRYILTLNNVKRSDLEDVGFRAVDLAVLREKRLNIPLTFVIRNDAFEDFMKENGLRAKIEKACQNINAYECYRKVLELFEKASFPEEVETELFEAYESLSIDPGASASRIVSEFDYPFVTLFRSPAYLLATDDADGIGQNIRGKEGLVKELKTVWASYFSPDSVAYRKKAGISEEFTSGVLVQKTKRIKHSAMCYSQSGFDENTIVVKGFTGMPEFGLPERILGKDVHEVDIDSLAIKKAEINVQEYSIIRDLDSGQLVKHELKELGSRQKLDDKQVYEVARITKRAKSFIGKDLKLYLGVRDAYTYVCLANRMIAQPQRMTEEKEEIKAEVTREGERVVEHKHEVDADEVAGEAVDMPKIISTEEAKEEILKGPDLDVKEEISEEKGEVIDEKQAFEEALEKDLEFLDEIGKLQKPKISAKIEDLPQIEEAEGDVEVELREEAEAEVEAELEKEIEKEINLLEEVIKIKEITERMEEHALNDNKPGYEQEARKLHDMIYRLREE